MWCDNRKSSSVKVLLLVTAVHITLVDTFQCGVRKEKAIPTILYGQGTSLADWPWHVAVLHRDGVSDKYACGGTLIRETFVLTADHCVRSENGFVLAEQLVFLRMGVHNLHLLDPRTLQQHLVNKIHVLENSKMQPNDISMLELKTVVQFTPFVQPVCLNEVEDLTRQFGTALGWGFTERNEPSAELKSARMPVVSTNQCLESNRDVFGTTLGSSLFCAGYQNGTTVCNGDSGGGIHFERNGIWYVGGIISFAAKRDSGFLCSTKGYAGFTSVYHFLPWIRSIVQPQYSRAISSPRNSVYLGEDPRSNKLPRDCGRHLVSRVRQGTNAEWLEFPWMAQIQNVASSGRRYEVGFGTVISKRYVLTSALGTSGYPKWQYVELGEYDRVTNPDCNVNDPNDCAPPVRVYKIEKIVKHPGFLRSSLNNNIALVRVTQNILFEDHIQPVCLPVNNAFRLLKLKKMIVTGWDNAQYDAKVKYDILQKGTVPVVGRAECKRSIKNKDLRIEENVICAGRPRSSYTREVDDREVDDGVPLGYLVQNNDIRFMQFGIHSKAGNGEVPSIYTNVPFYMDWILDNIEP